jgi:hypothetical protein
MLLVSCFLTRESFIPQVSIARTYENYDENHLGQTNYYYNRIESGRIAF